MMDVIRAETLKYKRTFTKKIIVFAPLIFILIAFIQTLYMPQDFLRPWQLLLALIYNWWPVVFIPLGIALFAALAALQEKKAGNYRNLRVHNISPGRIWLGKVAVMVYYTLLTTLVLMAVVVLAGLFTADGEIPWVKIIGGGVVLWLAALPLIPLQLWLATWKGTIGSMAGGILGLIAGVTAAPNDFWLFIPWSWPTRLICPIIGVHPNGVTLEAVDPLMNPSVIPVGIALAGVAFILFILVSAVWFARKEIQ